MTKTYHDDPFPTYHEDPSPTYAIEDLMKEHGLLNRLLLIYEEIVRRLKHDIHINKKNIMDSAYIIRYFIEDHHEKTEENYIFPLLINKNINVELVNELIKQHKISRKITDKIYLYADKLDNNDSKQQLIKYINLFVKMYRYHESREDTIIFQEFKKLFSYKEYLELSEKLEKEEEKVLGKNGYEKTLSLVESIEKELNIYDLSLISNEVLKNIYH